MEEGKALAASIKAPFVETSAMKNAKIGLSSLALGHSFDVDLADVHFGPDQMNP